MNILSRKKIVLLGMMSQMPVAGNIWLVVQYLIGFQRLGYDVYYVEAHGLNPSMLMRQPDDDSSALAVAFIDQVMQRFDLGDRWAFHALHADGRCYGMSASQLKELYRSAELVINLHGGTIPLPEHYAAGRLVYLGTDPVQVEIELFHNDQQAIDFLAPHCAFFTWGENYGNFDCRVPVSSRFHFRATRAPVVLEFWTANDDSPCDTFTTIGNWRQLRREITFQGEIYHWSKHYEFLKFLDLPARTSQAFELALSSGTCDEADQLLLRSKGWRVRDALEFSRNLGLYRSYIAQSRGEFTVAKDQNVRLRSGWFSERSAQYLAAGRPVITQETGFSNVLPTGDGLFSFSTLEEIVQALECINGDYQRHRQAAVEIARAYFNYDVVLTRMLHDLGVEGASHLPTAGHRNGSTANAPSSSLTIREHYTSDYYLQDCGGYDSFQKHLGKRLEDPRLQAVAALAGLKSCGRALDVGCGRGEITYYLARQGFDVTAVDYSASALALAEQCFAGEPQLRQRVQFVCDSICTAPLEGPFDLLVAGDVIQHLSVGELSLLVQEGVRWFDQPPSFVAKDLHIEVQAGTGEPSCVSSRVMAGKETRPTMAAPAASDSVVGVNLVGYLHTESGVGTAVRRYHRALRALGMDCALKDISSLQNNRSTDTTLAPADSAQLYDVNLVCADVGIHYAILSHLGEDFFAGRYNIGIWAWELPRFPEKWFDRFAYYDEIWVATSFIANCLGPISPLPVVRIPPVLTALHPGQRERGRQRLGVSAGEFVFLFVFDFHSYWQRKNPLALIEAFRKAFAPGDPVRLVLKCVNSESHPAKFAQLQDRARHYPVAICNGYWQAEEVADLMAACDAYVSLHRSEGTGLTITDALALGKPVIATGWSGNMDFMTARNSFPVEYDLVQLQANAGPYREGETWAEPSVDHAAELMRLVYSDREGAAARGQAARRDIESAYSEEAVAALIRQRLKTIGVRRCFAEFQRQSRGTYRRYRQLPDRFHEAAHTAVPAGSTVLVVSKGDDDLLNLNGRLGWHFPQDPTGVYAGYYPADSAAAVAHLEALRAKGAGYLAFPSTAFWWLDHYDDFRRHLDGRYQRVWHDEDCLIYQLEASANGASGGAT